MGSAPHLLSAFWRMSWSGTTLWHRPVPPRFEEDHGHELQGVRNIVVGLWVTAGSQEALPIREDSDNLCIRESAILALATRSEDLRSRLEGWWCVHIFRFKVTVKDLGCVGAMMVLLKDAITPISFRPGRSTRIRSRFPLRQYSARYE